MRVLNPMPWLPPQLCAVVLSENHWGQPPGRRRRALIREPGDLPATRKWLNDPSGGGGKDIEMTTASASLGASVSAQSRYMQLAMAALLGVFILGFVGFSHIEAVHNAAHDNRHSMAFPCH